MGPSVTPSEDSAVLFVEREEREGETPTKKEKKKQQDDGGLSNGATTSGH